MEMSFGKDFKEKHFSKLEKSLIPVNHGSMGGTPDLVLEKFTEAFMDSQLFVDEFYRFKSRKLHEELTKAISGPDLLDCDYKSLGFVDSATAGVSTILRSYPFKKGDKILLSSLTYGACAKAVKFVEHQVGIIPVVINLTYPISFDEIVNKFRAELSKGDIKLCLFDTVTSMPAARLPFERLVALCKEYSVLSLVDAAHGIGLVKFSISELQPDFLVTNLHKWLYVPKSCAVLYVDKKHHRVIQPLAISQAYQDPEYNFSTSALEEERMLNNFEYIGTMQKVQLATIVTAVDFRRNVCGGEDAIIKYCRDLAFDSVKHLQENYWKNSEVLGSGEDLVTSMINLEVPYTEWVDASFETVAKWIPQILHEICKDQRIFPQIFAHNGKIYTRLSCQVYNEVDDYVKGAKALEKGFKKFFANLSHFESLPLLGSGFLVVESK